MKSERHYGFRRYLSEIHRTGIRDHEAVPAGNETVLDGSWSILLPECPDRVLVFAAEDLRDYLNRTMDLKIPVRRGGPAEKTIRLDVKAEEKKHPRSYWWKVRKNAVEIIGSAPEGVRQGCFFMEDRMNLRRAPFLKKETLFREPLFSPRMVHSGWGLDQFPDVHLNAVAHAGFDSILLFVKAPGKTACGKMDFNDLVDRCEKYGLGVYFYSYLPSFKSPYDPDADAFFENSYGSVFQACPRAKGLILVGESCFFPSRDPRTSGQNREKVYAGEANDGIADCRPEPGSFPCCDYPDWLNAVKKAVFRHAPHADLVFWTYNWGNAPDDARRELIRNLPEDISLEVTFEVFQKVRHPGFQTILTDYTISFPGPGRCFQVEAEEAKKRGLRLYAMSNSAGRTWDFGMVPYVPAPFLWIRRFQAMREAHEKWGLSGIMDSHHYGWFPSEISECAKWAFWSPASDLKERLRRIAERNYGKEAAAHVLRAWKFWSKAMSLFSPSPDDMTGPLRIGPAYPLIFHPVLYPFSEQNMKFPTYPRSAAGTAWFHVLYQPENIQGMTNCGHRIPEEIRLLTRILAVWEKGDMEMRLALEKVPPSGKEAAEKTAGIGSFCRNTLRTLLHVKQWWLLNKRLEAEYDFKKAEGMTGQLLRIAEAETRNAEETIPLVEADSRLGWEPSMDYVCDAWHLRWKIRQLKNLKEHTIPEYRKSLRSSF